MTTYQRMLINKLGFSTGKQTKGGTKSPKRVFYDFSICKLNHRMLFPGLEIYQASLNKVPNFELRKNESL